jgi:hypothetical protein
VLGAGPATGGAEGGRQGVAAVHSLVGRGADFVPASGGRAFTVDPGRAADPGPAEEGESE